jgi:hypothetical protein
MTDSRKGGKRDSNRNWKTRTKGKREEQRKEKKSTMVDSGDCKRKHRRWSPVREQKPSAGSGEYEMD